MNSIFAYFVTITIFIQSATALAAADYSDFGSFCQTLRQQEVELIKKEVEEGLWTEVEAEELIDYIPKVEQCVCYYQKVLEGTGADFTLYMQKRAEIEHLQEVMADNNYRIEEIMDLSTFPEGLDLEAFISDIEQACGIYTE